MATKRWIGAAADVSQVDKVTIANTWAANDTITLEIGGVQFVVTIGTLVTTAQVAQTLKEAFNGEDLTDTAASYSPNNTGGAIAIPQFSEITASVNGSEVTLTGNTAGKDFDLTCTESTAGSGTATRSSVTAATGKNWWSNAVNWEDGIVPVDSDDLVFDQGDVDLSRGLSTGIQPASVRVDMGYTGNIGLTDVNTDGGTDATKYPEYRTKELTFDNNSVTTTYTIGRGSGAGSQMLRFNAGAGRVDMLVAGTSGTRKTPSLPNLTFRGTHASNAAVIQNGDVAFARNNGDTTVLTSLRVGTDSGSSARVYLGSELTLTTFVQSGGEVESYCSSTTHTQHGGNFYEMVGAPATLRVWGGVFHSRSTTTIATECTIGSSGSFDRSQDNRAKTITPNVDLHKSSKFHDPNSSLVLTAGFQTNGCKLAECEVDLGNNRTYTVA